MKKHDEDLNTTLIFVGYSHRSDARMLTWVLGRSVPRRHFCLHHLRKKHNSVPPYKGSTQWAETLSIKSPATELDNESDGELGKLEKMRETEFVGDVDAATEDHISSMDMVA